MPDRVLAERYELGEELGRGGMAVVYRARDRLLDRDVAVKVLGDKSSRDRFLGEAKRTARIRHPNVIEVFDTGEDAAEAFLVTELLRGESLAALLAREPRLEPGRAAAIAMQICEGLAASHALGVVHRDVKPGNIFLVGEDASKPPAVKVLDFGVAKRVDGSTVETDPGVMVGTFAYMSPEQIRGEEVDGLADLYAVGITLFRMLAGKLPFEQETAASLVFAHLTTPPPRLPGADGDPVIGRLERVVRRLLAKSRDDRPESAALARAEIARALEEPAEPLSLKVEPELGDPVSFEVDRGPEMPAAPAPMPIVYRPAERWPQAAPPRPYSPPTRAGSAFAALGVVPKSISKRVAGYSAFALLLSTAFFSPPASVIVLLSLLTVVGFAAWLAPER